MLALSWQFLDSMPGLAFQRPLHLLSALLYALASNASDFAALAFLVSPADLMPAVPWAMASAALMTCYTLPSKSDLHCIHVSIDNHASKPKRVRSQVCWP